MNKPTGYIQVLMRIEKNRWDGVKELRRSSEQGDSKYKTLRTRERTMKRMRLECKVSFLTGTQPLPILSQHKPHQLDPIASVHLPYHT